MYTTEQKIDVLQQFAINAAQKAKLCENALLAKSWQYYSDVIYEVIREMEEHDGN